MHFGVCQRVRPGWKLVKDQQRRPTGSRHKAYHILNNCITPGYLFPLFSAGSGIFLKFSSKSSQNMAFRVPFLAVWYTQISTYVKTKISRDMRLIQYDLINIQFLLKLFFWFRFFNISIVVFSIAVNSLFNCWFFTFISCCMIFIPAVDIINNFDLRLDGT